jgi:predicted flap endonuclease-1-like 5' DNA nuclease
MTNNNEGLICAIGAWAVALILGTVVAALLWVLGGWSFMQGAFMGAITFLGSGVLSWWTMCRPLPPSAAHASPYAAMAASAPAAAPAPVASAPVAARAPASAAAPVAAAPAVKAMAELKGEAEVAAHKDDWKYSAAAAPAAATAPAASVAPAGKPAGLSAARGGKADDLKRIKGVGPKLEALLHSMGYFHFDQIAGWTAAEVAWVDENLEGFKGRVTRDEWVKQAGLLATGAETDFSKRVDKGDVY